MTNLTAAVEAAERRKAVIFGDPEQSGLEVARDTFQKGAIFSGFDIDPTEVDDISVRVGYFFMHMAATVGLRTLFSAAWIDGLLVGLLASQQLAPPTTDPGGSMDAATGEGKESR